MWFVSWDLVLLAVADPMKLKLPGSGNQGGFSNPVLRVYLCQHEVGEIFHVHFCSGEILVIC